MKRKTHGSITTKLLAINAITLCIFIGIILVVHTSFINVESSVSGIIDKGVNRIVTNAQLGRDLTKVFAGIKSVIAEDAEDENRLKREGENLILTLSELAQKSSSDAELQEALLLFSDKLGTVLDQATQLNHVTQTIHTLEQALLNTLQELDNLVAEKRLFVTLEGGDVSLIEQLIVSIARYRETALQIAIEFARIKQESLTEAESAAQGEVLKPEQQYSALFSLLGDLRTRFQTLDVTDQEITDYGQRLTGIIIRYQETFAEFHQVQAQFQQDVREMNATQEDVLERMKQIDQDTTESTGEMQGEVSGVIGDSERIIFVLSVVFFGVLGLAWWSTRRMTKPLVSLAWCAEQLADGDIETYVQDIQARDEVGTLSQAFRKLMAYFREMAHAVTEISRGNLDLEVTPRSPKDVLGNGFRQMVVYLKDMGQFATHVAEGDLRTQITLRSQSDQLGNAFIHMRQGLIALIAEIRSGADRMASISKQVLTTSTTNSEALSHIGHAAEVTSSAMQQVNSSAQEVRINTENLSSSVEQTSASITEMISSIKHVAENTRKLAGFADETRATMTGIVTSLDTVNNQAAHSKKLAETTTRDAGYGQEAVEQMIAKINAISDVTQRISDTVARLESRSTEIGTILDVINEVAAQTSLLALNASIIAAQAGVHGRSFAVVADEIKELATRVGTSTEKIAAIVKSVQQDSFDAVIELDRGQQEVESGVLVAREAGEALQKIAQSAQNSSTVAAEIAVLVRDQTTVSNRVAESMQDVTNMVNEITGATQEQEKNSVQLFTVVENMQGLASQVARATQEQQQSTLHVTELMEDVISQVDQSAPTVEQLAQSANELAAQADVLTKQVERFTLPV